MFMDIAWSNVRNPVLDREPTVSVRDPALLLHDGVIRCFHTAVERGQGGYRLFVDMAESTDLAHWGNIRRLTRSDLNFSSPGNVLQVGDRWLLCVQSYPIRPGEVYGSEESRLWLMESRDMVDWSDPLPLAPQGCQARWSKSPRQIDPYIVAHDSRYWCYYKSAGCLGLMVSPDLVEWQEASPDRPVLSREDTPDNSTVENPCVVADAGEFVLFFSPCRPGRGIGVARSDDLVHWRSVRYLDFPLLPWAPGGSTAAFVADWRETCGRWVMAFHGERNGPHGAALGLAVSDDLEHWDCP
jgi:beta-xylosidase